MQNLFRVTGCHAEPFVPTCYERERVLQDLVAKNPSLLVHPSDPDDYRLYYVSEEMALPSSFGTTLRIDVVFVDSRAVPVIVEVKRKSDSRIHNEVMTQLLDYASHLNLCDFDSLISNLKTNNTENNFDGMTFTSDFISRLRENIDKGIMKLVIVADSIPKTLGRTILFMNRQMPSIDLYGVELPLFSVNGTIVVSRSFIAEGQSYRDEKPSNRSAQWSYENLTSRFHEVGNPKAADNLIESVKMANKVGIDVVYGSGSFNPTVSFMCNDIQLFYECFSFKAQGGGVVYINHRNIIQYANAVFKSKESIVNYLSEHGFNRDDLKVGINSTTFYLRLLNTESRRTAFESFITVVRDCIAKALS